MFPKVTARGLVGKAGNTLVCDSVLQPNCVTVCDSV